MKILVSILIFSIMLPAAARAQNYAGKSTTKAPSPSKLHGELAPRPYTFDRYIADLKESARKDEPKPDNPVTEEEAKQVAANKYKNYKPLNPFVVEW